MGLNTLRLRGRLCGTLQTLGGVRVQVQSKLLMTAIQFSATLLCIMWRGRPRPRPLTSWVDTLVREAVAWMRRGYHPSIVLRYSA